MTTIPVGALVRDRELPELGPGRIVAELDGGASRIRFGHSEEIRDVQVSRVEVSRLPLIPGVEVEVRSGRFGSSETERGMVVDAELPETAEDLCDYVVEVDGDERTVSEAELFPIEPDSSEPLDQLDALFWRGPFRFFARWGMHRTISRLYEDSEGIPSLVGARMTPTGPRIRGARRALWNRDRRVLLADPDPFDRMYTAGTVLQAEFARQPNRRAVVVAPGGMAREWSRQLELRFGGRSFRRLDLREVEASEFAQMVGMFRDDRLVVSHEVLEQSRDARTLLAGEGTETLIVAGAAHLDPESGSYEFARELSELAESAYVLSPLSDEPDPAELATLSALVDPAEYEPDDTELFEDIVERREDVWTLIDETERGDWEDSSELVERWRQTEIADESAVAGRIDDFEADGDAADELVGYVRRFHALPLEVVRTPDDGSRPERDCEELELEASEAREALGEHVADLPTAESNDELQKVLVWAYQRALASTPDRVAELLRQRGEALELKRRAGDEARSVAAEMAGDPALEREQIAWDLAVEQAPELEDERDWIGEALGLVEEWKREAPSGGDRFASVIEWLADAAAEREAEKFVVFSRSPDTIERFTPRLRDRLGNERVAMHHVGLPVESLQESLNEFQQDEECRVLVTDESAGYGRRIDVASTVVHLDQPRTPERLERRLSRIAAPSQQAETVRSLVIGGSPLESGLLELYRDALGLYAARPTGAARRRLELGAEVFDVLATGGPAALGELVETAGEEVGAESAESSAFRAAIEPTEARRQEVEEFAELLDFVDGIDNPLPVRHWARMLGLDDHRVRPGVYDFKWHWSSVRRDLAGFHVPEGEDPEEWTDEETVQYLSGTFSRRRALDDETLEFFAPGHRLVDALIRDAEGPNDGRATIFARRLGAKRHGDVFAVVVARCAPDPSYWPEDDAPQGLLRRTYRRFWPESASVSLELDLSGEAEPAVVDDADLERRLEEAYEGPEADQKVEYETLIRAVEDARAFRTAIHDAADAGLDALRDDRQPLVDVAADQLEDDFAPEIDYWEDVLEETDDDEIEARAERAIEWRRSLVESVRDYRMEVDAFAVVVGGDPEALIRG
ncbi:MAG: helicase-related protein [Bradymonadaceae bacterium]